MRQNVRLVIDVLEFYEQHPEKKLGMFFLDVEKAFNINWEFMFEVLDTIEVGDNFLKNG